MKITKAHTHLKGLVSWHELWFFELEKSKLFLCEIFLFYVLTVPTIFLYDDLNTLKFIIIIFFITIIFKLIIGLFCLLNLLGTDNVFSLGNLVDGIIKTFQTRWHSRTNATWLTFKKWLLLVWFAFSILVCFLNSHKIMPLLWWENKRKQNTRKFHNKITKPL